MPLETPDRIHAAAVCFWERTVIPPPTNRYAVGYLSRHNFAGPIVLPLGDSTPSILQLTLLQPIGKAQATCLLSADVQSDAQKAGISIGPPLTPEVGLDPINNAAPDVLQILNLNLPDRMIGAGSIGDRALFYVIVLGNPITEEGA